MPAGWPPGSARRYRARPGRSAPRRDSPPTPHRSPAAPRAPPPPRTIRRSSPPARPRRAIVRARCGSRPPPCRAPRPRCRAAAAETPRRRCRHARRRRATAPREPSASATPVEIVEDVFEAQKHDEPRCREQRDPCDMQAALRFGGCDKQPGKAKRHKYRDDEHQIARVVDEQKPVPPCRRAVETPLQPQKGERDRRRAEHQSGRIITGAATMARKITAGDREQPEHDKLGPEVRFIRLSLRLSHSLPRPLRQLLLHPPPQAGGRPPRQRRTGGG